MAGIDCTNLALTSPLRCLCETTIIFILLSQDVLTGHFTAPFSAFSEQFEVFDCLHDAEQRRLFKFEQMMEVINRLFWKTKKRKGNFIALAARSTEGDGTTYNTGGASNVPTKCRELIFHAVTKIPIIPRPRRVVHHDDSDSGGGGTGGRKRKVDQALADMDERLNAELMKFRTDGVFGFMDERLNAKLTKCRTDGVFGFPENIGVDGKEGISVSRTKTAGGRSTRTAQGYGVGGGGGGGKSKRTRTAAAAVTAAAVGMEDARSSLEMMAAGLAAVAEAGEEAGAEAEAEAGAGARTGAESQGDDEAEEASARLEEEVAAAVAFGEFGAAVHRENSWGVCDGVATNMSQMSQFSQVSRV
jgi:hypothetical protein